MAGIVTASKHSLSTKLKEGKWIESIAGSSVHQPHTCSYKDKNNKISRWINCIISINLTNAKAHGHTKHNILMASPRKRAGTPNWDYSARRLISKNTIAGITESDEFLRSLQDFPKFSISSQTLHSSCKQINCRRNNHQVVAAVILTVVVFFYLNRVYQQ